MLMQVSVIKNASFSFCLKDSVLHISFFIIQNIAIKGKPASQLHLVMDLVYSFAADQENSICLTTIIIIKPNVSQLFEINHNLITHDYEVLSIVISLQIFKLIKYFLLHQLIFLWSPSISYTFHFIYWLFQLIKSIGQL